ncbi:hypothetical protein KC644_00680 [Candidatus Berkelbacteria bacterium]|nr:hypothetical protein [Candidatus Berkelbacteria bacterium]
MLAKASQEKLWGILRILMGWIFLWPFLDKLYGLGFTTSSDQAWLKGISPTTGFLNFATQGPFSDLFKSLAGNSFVDWLFMIGLLLIGLSLILGIGIRIATYSGSLLLFLMYLAVLPPEHNPVIDEHIIYAVLLFTLNRVDAGRYMGFGNTWQQLPIVKKFPCLR